MSINLTAPTVYVDAVLIGDPVSATGASNDYPPTLTKVANVPVSAALEIQSTVAGLLLPRMTTAQMNAIVTPIAGLMIFNTTAVTAYVYQAGAWTAVGSGAGTVTAITQGANIVATPNPIIGAGTIALNPVLTGLTSAVIGNMTLSGNTILDAANTVIVSALGLNLRNNTTSMSLRFYDSSGNNYTSFQSVATIAPGPNVTYVLPATQGGAGTKLTNDGAGNLSWT